MKNDLHPACSAWPEMKPEELCELAADIGAYGLRDPVTLTPDGLLLDGLNWALAFEIAGVVPATTIFDGDPWLFSLSRNKHRRHMTTDQIALIAARLATRTVGNPQLAIASNEAIGNAEATKAAGVPETAIDSAKVVHGKPDENEISRNIANGAHTVLLLDRAGWHITGKLDVPDNITPIFLPSRAPELNPVENVWQYLRQNWLSNTVFENYDAIIDAHAPHGES